MPIKLKPLKKIKSGIIPPPKVGEILQGKVSAIDRSSIFLDLGNQGIGIIYGIEFKKAHNTLKSLKIDDIVSAKLVNLEDEDGYRELSLIDASKEMTWKELKTLKEKNEVFDVKVKKANKGGLIAEINGVPAFLPVSHLSPKNYPKVEDGNPVKIGQALQKFIGESLTVKIIDLDRKKDKFIISEKTKETSKESETEKQDLIKYKTGDVVNGEISGITSFGAFVKLDDSTEGLLYPSEIPQKDKTKEELKIKQKVKVKIIKIADDKIYLSLKI
jgi:small subunit ribosomal protein S1